MKPTPSLSDFDFELPAERIAQEPLPDRSSSRLLRLNRSTDRLDHLRFSDLPTLLRCGDLLVVNRTRVIRARLVGKKKKTGGKAELLLIGPDSEVAPDAALAAKPEAYPWRCLGQASKGLKVGTRVELAGSGEAEILEDTGEGEYRVRFSSSRPSLSALLEEAGQIPLPAYIHRSADDRDGERYQTVFAATVGSVAAPTAGLHFTEALLDRLISHGVEQAAITLDVGPGTFIPVRGSIEQHRMHSERYVVPPEAARKIQLAKSEGRRVVCVGTTVVRTLESAWDSSTGTITEGEGRTALFIRPGFSFRVTDALITNFHLPQSTLLMLVSAFAGRERILSAYRQAVLQGYRFYSYGDAMLIE